MCNAVGLALTVLECCECTPRTTVQVESSDRVQRSIRRLRQNDHNHVLDAGVFWPILFKAPGFAVTLILNHWSTRLALDGLCFPGRW